MAGDRETGFAGMSGDAGLLAPERSVASVDKFRIGDEQR
jgi:hypothetical protein